MDRMEGGAASGHGFCGSQLAFLMGIVTILSAVFEFLHALFGYLHASIEGTRASIMMLGRRLV